MTGTRSALPLATKDYSQEYMNRLIKQIEISLQKLETIRPITVASDRTNQVAAFPISGLTIQNIPTTSTGLPSGSVWSDGGILKIVS